MTRTDWRREIAKELPRARFDEPMRLHTTFRIGGPADCYAEVHDRKELRAVLAVAGKYSLPVFYLGWGSNILVRDKGMRGIVLRLRGEFERIDFQGEGRVRAGAGVRTPQLVSQAAERGLTGIEPLVGVPGTVGGALVMNAGTREAEIGPFVLEVETFDVDSFKTVRLAPKDLRFEYRRSNLEGRLVLGCLLQLKAGSKGDIIRRIQRHQQTRLQTQPVHAYNVGSTFKNPPGRFVAKLIEDAGLKGRSVGGARVSPLHANFFENVSDAAADDVLGLVHLVREKIRKDYGVELELEMKVIGEA